MKHRVVITGMGVVAPNAVGINNFLAAIQEGRSGITFHQKLQEELNSAQTTYLEMYIVLSVSLFDLSFRLFSRRIGGNLL